MPALDTQVAAPATAPSSAPTTCTSPSEAVATTAMMHATAAGCPDVPVQAPAGETTHAHAPSPPPPPPAARPPKPPPSSSSTLDLPGRLCFELERKLRLAAEAAELSHDRDAICGEAFSDLVGALDAPARAALLPSSSSSSPSAAPPRPVLYYEVLAPYLASHPARAEGFLTVAKRLWGQPYVAPLYTLLLHRWLLAGASSGSGARSSRRSSGNGSGSASAALLGEARHLLVLVRGAQQLFWADVHAGGRRFEPLFSWLVNAVVLAGGGGGGGGGAAGAAGAAGAGAGAAAAAPSLPPSIPPAARLRDLPFNPRVGLTNVTAAFAPYYLGPAALAAALAGWPSAAAPEDTAAAASTSGRPPSSTTPTTPVPQHSSGAATLLTEAADMLGLMKGEAGLLTYLHNLRGWAGCEALSAAPRGARLRLQAELYGLTARGGPRYLPASVREAAFMALDELFPAGRAPRRAVAAAVRLWLHPAALPAVAAEAALTAAGWASGAVRVAAGAASAVACGLGVGGGGVGGGDAAPRARDGMGEGGALSRMMG